LPFWRVVAVYPEGAFRVGNTERAALYRRRAAEMLMWGEKTEDHTQRRILLSIAAMYHRLAEQLEREDPDQSA
jgi:hypothetical protein